jgi:hypothetical protein
MVLDSSLIKKISDYVKQKPRSIQEISIYIKKNWRTTERYVERIEEETGFISTRIFRKGTRGALKIVYWKFIEDIHSTSFQEDLLNDIMNGRRTQDFSPFDVYQHIDEKKRIVFVEDETNVNSETMISDKVDLAGLFRKAEKQILIFSGNLTWACAKQGKINIIDVVREVAKRNVSIKIIGRISLVGVDNAKKLLAINKELGKEMIEIKHHYQPLRVIIIDNKIIRLKEIRDPSYYNEGELDKRVGVFYEIYDSEWIEWIQKVFWKMFSNSINAIKRIKEIESIDKKLV